MEELFGLSMDLIMVFLLVIFLAGMAAVGVMALRNRIMLKLALRNIPRRRAQTVLIIVGVMLSTVIMAAAFGTGDTLSFSIRTEAVKALGTIDEIIFSNKAAADDRFGVQSYVPYDRFEQLQRELADLDDIDGLAPLITEAAPTVNQRSLLSEGDMNITAVDPALLKGFDTLSLTSGEEARLEDLASNEVYISDNVADELGAIPGDELHMFVAGEAVSVKVRGVVNPGALAGASWEPTMLLPLDRAQKIFDREGQINTILVSNRGDERGGAELSEEVTRRLRVLFSNRRVAGQLQELLNQPAVLTALETRAKSLDGQSKTDLELLRQELGKQELSDDLIALLADEDVSDEVLEAVDNAGLGSVELQADTLFDQYGEFRVFDIKRIVLDVADDAGSFATTLFVAMGMFSILVGVLLIFLIFVMLAAARRSEMGMARAVGAKRSHLVQMFVFEGTAYAVVSAAVGVLLGLGISAVMVVVMNWIISSFDVGFQLTTHFEPRSAIVAYCLGMVITFATIAVSAYRVSRMNIVVAIRGLPETLVISGEQPFLTRLSGLPKAIIRPLLFLVRGMSALLRRRLAAFAVNVALAVLWVVIFPVWIVDVIAGLVRFSWPYFLRGWLTLLLGLLIVWTGTSESQDSIFYAGLSLMIIGLGLMGQKALKRTSLRADVRDRIAFTSAGVAMLVIWALPPDTFEGLAGTTLRGDVEMMFVSGIFMVTAAVWTVMYNADLLLKAFTFLMGRIGKLRPVLVTAVAYPMSAKFRTGLTLAMFALVMFTVVVMSVIVDSFGTSITSDVDAVTGGWDIDGDVNFNTPIQDIRKAIDDHPQLNIGDFEAVGGFTKVPIEARQVGAEQQRWRSYSVWAADDDYLDATNHKLKVIADGYGNTSREVFQALKNDPSLTVVEGSVVATRPGESSDFPPFQLEGVYYESDTMSPVDIEVREPLTGTVVPLTVIGVLDKVHDPFEIIFGMLTSKRALDEVPFSIPITSYQFRAVEGVDVKKATRDLEASFRENGMETEVLEEQIDRAVDGIRGFYYVLIGFMALGLVVGIAGLGVISTRAVVERRQQIGVLRAIGYRRRMIQLSFLIESSFVALLGIIIGIALGLVLSNNAITDIRTEEGVDTLRFSVPWIQIIVILVVAYLFSLVTTFIPARQASRTLPAEALRYE